MDNRLQHIGIIMDGNGRWAKKRLKPRLFGHHEGMKRVIEIVEYAVHAELKVLSVYAFSTDNWKRPTEEVNGLMKILVEYINSEIQKLHENNVQLRVMGDISVLPSFIYNKIVSSIELTKNNTGLIFNIGINYGGHEEILNAVNQFIKKNPGKIMTQKDIEDGLYTSPDNNVDLMIRTGGEQRLSNFMLYQCSYSELYFTPTYWPDFHSEELEQIIQWFYERQRRFGGL